MQIAYELAVRILISWILRFRSETMSSRNKLSPPLRDLKFLSTGVLEELAILGYSRLENSVEPDSELVRRVFVQMLDDAKLLTYPESHERLYVEQWLVSLYDQWVKPIDQDGDYWTMLEAHYAELQGMEKFNEMLNSIRRPQ